MISTANLASCLDFLTITANTTQVQIIMLSSLLYHSEPTVHLKWVILLLSNTVTILN